MDDFERRLTMNSESTKLQKCPGAQAHGLEGMKMLVTLAEQFHADRFELIQLYYHAQRDQLIKAVFVHVFGAGTEETYLAPEESKNGFYFTREEAKRYRVRYLAA